MKKSVKVLSKCYHLAIKIPNLLYKFHLLKSFMEIKTNYLIKATKSYKVYILKSNKRFMAIKTKNPFVSTKFIQSLYTSESNNYFMEKNTRFYAFVQPLCVQGLYSSKIKYKFMKKSKMYGCFTGYHLYLLKLIHFCMKTNKIGYKTAPVTYIAAMPNIILKEKKVKLCE